MRFQCEMKNEVIEGQMLGKAAEVDLNSKYVGSVI